MNKHDQGKLRWDLVPWRALKAVVAVLTFGATKYAPGGWKTVPGARERYFAAIMRHLTAWWDGERIDPESKLPTLAHVICCALFLLGFEVGDAEAKP